MDIQSPAFTAHYAIRSLELMVGDKRYLKDDDCLVSALIKEGYDLIEAEVDLEPWLARVKEINRALSLRQVGVHKDG